LDHDVIVVGGGMAGLTATAFMAAAGHSVLLCEKEQHTGGLIQSFERNGFIFDAGIRAIEDSGIIFPMLRNLGISIDFVKSPVSLGIADRMIPVVSATNLADYEALLAHFYPDHQQDIQAIIADIKLVMKHMEVLYGIENPVFKDLRHDREYLMRVLLPWLGKFLSTIGKINRMNEPVEEHLRQFTSCRPLIDIISQHFFKKTPAFFAMSYFSLYLDYCYPAGGTGVLPRKIQEFCLANKAEIRTGTAIVRVDPDAHTVCDDSGLVHHYRKLVWAADLKTLYRSIDSAALADRKVRRRTQARAAQLQDMVGGDSVFTLYLAVDLDPTYFADIANGHIFYTPSSKGVGADMQRQLETLLAQATGLEPADFRQAAMDWIADYIRSTTFEISIPVLKDSALAPAGQTGLIVSVLFDHALCKVIQDQGWYVEFKRFTEDCLIAGLETTLYPRIGRAILERFSYTPLSIARIAGTSDGAITGWAFTNPEMPAVNQMQRVARSILTPLPDVYQAGQWAFSPSGLPIAILTAKLAADRVNKELR
jgi:phytoene dehydrogenase-like protein